MAATKPEAMEFLSSHHVDAFKMLGDYAKWVAGIATLIIAASSNMLGGKIHGWVIYLYAASMLLLVLSVLSTGVILILVSGVVANQVVEDDEDWTNAQITATRLAFATSVQAFIFLLGAISFAICLMFAIIGDPKNLENPPATKMASLVPIPGDFRCVATLNRHQRCSTDF